MSCSLDLGHVYLTVNSIDRMKENENSKIEEELKKRNLDRPAPIVVLNCYFLGFLLKFSKWNYSHTHNLENA